ncbi:MAG TPA: M1 family aminopeptidase, partial [Candidatus Eisenbacteria bacterium]|nr:M1 family aminopeptidase [Candidatus Eisenbacteria bacterium]
MSAHDPLFHPVFLGRRAAMESPPFEAFPPNGRSPWSGPDSSRRDLDFHVRHYRIALDVDFAKKEIRGRVALTIEAVREGLREAVLDAAELRVASVRAGSRRLSHAVDGARLRVTLPKALGRGRRVTLEVAYSATPRKGFFFTGPTEAEPERSATAWTQGQADDTHWWMPCLESTESRATLEQIVTVPAGFRVIGNGRLIARRINRRARTVTWHWKQETAHPAYLTSLVVGKYAEIKDRAGDTPLQYYVPRGEERIGRSVFRKTPKMIAAFERAFGHPYPYPKYAQTTVSDFTYGGMENTSATTMFDRMLQMPGDSLDEGYDSLVAHELAHQWWGDLVTCRHWSEGWLNEGFATYAEIIWREADTGREDADFARLEQMCSYLVEDSSEYRRRIVETRYEYATEIFDRHLYEKGALVLHMLRSVVGDEPWRRSLKRYLARHAFRPVETSDLRRAFEEETGRNLAWFFDQWVHGGGHPEVRVTRRYDEETRALTLILEQTQAEDGVTPVFRLPMMLEVVAGGKRVRIPIEFRERRETHQIPLPSRPRYVALDPEHHVMKILDFQRTDEELRYGLAHSPHSLERVRCARELARHADPRTIAALLASLRGDSFWGVRSAAAVSLGEIGTRVPGLAERIGSAGLRAHTRVRRAVIWALGTIADESSLKLLKRYATTEKSTFNAGWALIGIAKAGKTGAFETLRGELERPSHRDMLPILILDGMAILKDPRALDLILERTEARYRNETRGGATRALGKLGIASEPVVTRLVALLKDPWFRVRTAAAWSLGKLKPPQAEGAIVEAMKS